MVEILDVDSMLAKGSTVIGNRVMRSATEHYSSEKEYFSGAKKEVKLVIGYHCSTLVSTNRNNGRTLNRRYW